MKYKLLVKAEAVQDMTEAFDWYESEKAGLGLEFLNEVEEYYNLHNSKPATLHSL
jgi:toxin ParE1/3/4